MEMDHGEDQADAMEMDHGEDQAGGHTLRFDPGSRIFMAELTVATGYVATVLLAITLVIGPVNLSFHDEMGLLVDVANAAHALRADPGAVVDRILHVGAAIGLDRLMARGYFEAPQSGRDAVQQLEDLSSPISAFIRDTCDVGTTQRVGVDDLWEHWKRWCTDDNRHPGTKAVFGRDLKAAVPTIKKARLRDDDDRAHDRMPSTDARSGTPGSAPDIRAAPPPMPACARPPARARA